MDGMSETFVPIVFVGHFGAESMVVNSAHVAGLKIVASSANNLISVQLH